MGISLRIYKNDLNDWARSLKTSDEENMVLTQLLHDVGLTGTTFGGPKSISKYIKTIYGQDMSENEVESNINSLIKKGILKKNGTNTYAFLKKRKDFKGKSYKSFKESIDV